MKTQTIRIQKKLIARIKRNAKKAKLSVCEYVSDLLGVLK
jgi:predicted HicB family RNase H-like nuclease